MTRVEKYFHRFCLLAIACLVAIAAPRAAKAAEPGLLRAALVADGAGPGEIAAAEQRFQRLRDQLLALPWAEYHGKSVAEETFTRGATLLLFLHEFAASGDYDQQASSVATLLVDGDYNCLSASIVYVLLAREIGLSANLRLEAGHVTVALQAQDQIWRIETTQPLGWIPGDTTVTGRLLSDAQAIGLVAYNRAAHQMRDGEFSRAVPRAILAAWLDPRHGPALKNAVIACQRSWLAGMGGMGGIANLTSPQP